MPCMFLIIIKEGDIMKAKTQKIQVMGFTLLELIVVVSILSILASIVIIKVGSFADESAIKAHETNVNVLYKACLTYEATHPGVAVTNENIQDSLKSYIKNWPQVPKGYQSAAGEPQSGQDYIVTISENGDININPGK